MSDARRSGWRGAISAGCALAASELMAGLFDPLPSLASGVATLIIDFVPAPIKNAAIAVFGLYDKLALGIGIIVVTLALGYLLSKKGVAQGAIAVFGLAAALASVRDPQVGLVESLVAGLLASGVGIGVYRFTGRSPETDVGRREAVRSLTILAGAALVAGITGRLLIDRARSIVTVRLPEPADRAAPPRSVHMFDVEGVSPLITPTAEFYRIDTVPFSVPRVDIGSWNLRVDGLVERPLTLDFSDLSGMPMVERHITLSCVSNRVGGDLIGTATWLGVPLRDVLDLVGVRPDASQVVGRSVDGFTVGFPTPLAYDGRDALVAVGMNGEPLPAEHGFPARLVVAGLYGYVSATKWLAQIELTRWEDFDAYWVPRGWAKEAPIKTQSRIDTPRHRSNPPAGPGVIAGVAWAPVRGISKVEVQIDGGPWQETQLTVPLSDSTWVQWRLDWDATPGRHEIRVRATDGDFETQTAQVSTPAPDGATGWHRVVVNVS